MVGVIVPDAALSFNFINLGHFFHRNGILLGQCFLLLFELSLLLLGLIEYLLLLLTRLLLSFLCFLLGFFAHGSILFQLDVVRIFLPHSLRQILKKLEECIAHFIV